MGEAAASTEAAIHELRASLDLLHGNVARIDTTQQQLVAQVDLMSAAVQAGAKTNADTVRQLTALQDRLLATTQGIDRVHGHPPSPEEDDADPGDMDRRHSRCVFCSRGCGHWWRWTSGRR
jgi:hypothetical protein